MRNLLRGLFVVGGLLVTQWFIFNVPSLSWSAIANDTSIRAGLKLKLEDLNDVSAKFEAAPEANLLSPQIVRTRALVGLRLAEELLARNHGDLADKAYAFSEKNLRRALDRIPSDSFLWMALYSVMTTHYGASGDNSRFLAQSYLAGPYEGWITVNRNRLALAIFEEFDPAAQGKIISEFARMVDSGFTVDAASVLLGVGWKHREALLAGLRTADLRLKEELAIRLFREGVNVSVPGVESRESWRWR